MNKIVEPDLESVGVKVVGKSGQISLGKKYAGKTLRLERRKDGALILTAVAMVPEHQHWTLKEPDRSRVTQRQQRISLTIAPPSWAEAGLSYTRSSSSSSLEPNAVAPQRTQLDALEGTVTYTASTWQARFSSTYSS